MPSGMTPGVPLKLVVGVGASTKQILNLGAKAMNGWIRDNPKKALSPMASGRPLSSWGEASIL